MGMMPFASTLLDEELAIDDVVSIDAIRTVGFPESGIIIIDDERIGYSSTTATSFDSNVARPMVRGLGDTDASAHLTGAKISQLESSLMNSSVDYNLAVMADAAGAQAFLSVPTAVFDILLAYGTAPFAFLGTDLQILTAIWAVMFIGMVVSFFIMVAGGRRV